MPRVTVTKAEVLQLGRDFAPGADIPFEIVMDPVEDTSTFTVQVDVRATRTGEILFSILNASITKGGGDDGEVISFTMGHANTVNLTTAWVHARLTGTPNYDRLFLGYMEFNGPPVYSS